MWLLFGSISFSRNLLFKLLPLVFVCSFHFCFPNIYTEMKFKEILWKEFSLSDFDKYFYLPRVKLVDGAKGHKYVVFTSRKVVHYRIWIILTGRRKSTSIVTEPSIWPCNISKNIFPFQKNKYLYNLPNILLTSAIFLTKHFLLYSTSKHLPVDKRKNNDMKYITLHYYFLTLPTLHKKWTLFSKNLTKNFKTFVCNK